MAQIDDFADVTKFTRTTAEGLYNREKQQLQQNQQSSSSKSQGVGGGGFATARPSQKAMKFDFNPVVEKQS